MNKISPKVNLGIIQNHLGFTGKEYKFKLTANESEVIETDSFPLISQEYLAIEKHYVFATIPKLETLKVQVFELTDDYHLLAENSFEVHNRTSVLDDDMTGFRILSFGSSSDSNSLTLFADFEDLEVSYRTDAHSIKKVKNALDIERNILAALNNGNNVPINLFLNNLRFPIYFLALSTDFINWKSSIRTLFLLMLLTFVFLNPIVSFTVLPILVIVLHLWYRTNLITFRLERNRDELSEYEKIKVFLELASVYNKMISQYTAFLVKLEKTDSDSIRKFHKQLLKLALIGGCALYFLTLDRMCYLAVFFLWRAVLMRNSFFAYIFNCLFGLVKKLNFISNGDYILSCFVPFYDFEVLERQSLQRSFSYISEKTTVFEILENERWWIVSGFCKNLILTDRPAWSDITGKLPMEKQNVKLPDNNYEWTGFWEIVIGEDTDKDGWKYGMDFSQKLDAQNTTGCLVRSRKWKRTCVKI